MIVINTNYSILEINNLKEKIDPKPQYQRTQVWKIDRKRLLIDSIIRGYDLPKFYLNELKGNVFYDFEVCDGQQRLRALWEFLNNDFAFGNKISIQNLDVSRMYFKDLPKDLKLAFKNYNLTVAIIKEATQDEIRDLFARLQKGMGLNQAELRRALSTHIGIYVESIVENHPFFIQSGIPDIRNKHQDYVDHIIAYLLDGFENDFKGANLQEIYNNISPLKASELIKTISSVLDEIHKINNLSYGVFRNKWAFVDVFIYIHQVLLKGKNINHDDFFEAFKSFEERRKSFSKQPNRLIDAKNHTSADVRLYDYIIAFTKDGALKKNMKKRNSVFIAEFDKLIK